jgi:hypothetical protein
MLSRSSSVNGSGLGGCTLYSGPPKRLEGVLLNQVINLAGVPEHGPEVGVYDVPDAFKAERSFLEKVEAECF